ncbi:MAG: hypothetical protein HGJ94_17695 [Desulfosarcina sp.]|nr:hypothetical protein [Desulfosarcina sp.]MBC2744748.1 hypothetical protein [Desulfosarcina sp.]MBC2767656.1 hypothetical protein [Desulfosarcina sp.]
MKSKKFIGIVLSVLLLAAMPASAEKSLVESVANGCKAELQTYCKDVTPGDGRILACLYAHGDKLSGQCEYALYDAAVQLERAVAALAYVANECADDLDQYCSDVPMGQGRLLKCLEKNDKKVSQRCKQALKDVGAKK